MKNGFREVTVDTGQWILMGYLWRIMRKETRLTGNIDESDPILSTTPGEVFLVCVCFSFCSMDKIFQKGIKWTHHTTPSFQVTIPSSQRHLHLYVNKS